MQVMDLLGSLFGLLLSCLCLGLMLRLAFAKAQLANDNVKHRPNDLYLITNAEDLKW